MPKNFKQYVTSKRAHLDNSRYIVRDTPNEGVFIYCAGDKHEWEDSATGSRNYNDTHQDSKGEKIVCRQLGFAWLQYHKRRRDDGKSYQKLFNDAEQIKQIKFLMENEFDRKRIEFRAHQYGIASIHHNGLGLLLQQLCQNMQSGQERYLTLCSENHTMALVVGYKNVNLYIVKFFDPNSTVVHHRAICNGLIGLRQLQLADFLSGSAISWYFPGHETAQQMVLSVYNNLNLDELPESREDWYFERVGNLSDVEEASVLTQQLNCALSFGSEKEIKNLIQEIIIRNSSQVMNLLQTKNSEGCSWLFMAVKSNHIKTVKAYIESVIAVFDAGILARSQCMELLEINDARSGKPNFLVMLVNHPDVVSSLITTFMRSQSRESATCLRMIYELLPRQHRRAIFKTIILPSSLDEFDTLNQLVVLGLKKQAQRDGWGTPSILFPPQGNFSKAGIPQLINADQLFYEEGLSIKEILKQVKKNYSRLNAGEPLNSRPPKRTLATSLNPHNKIHRIFE